MSNARRLRSASAFVTCGDCGLVFAGEHELQMHFKHLPEAEARLCLNTRTMREVLGFYRSRGAWRLGKMR